MSPELSGLNSVAWKPNSRRKFSNNNNMNQDYATKFPSFPSFPPNLNMVRSDSYCAYPAYAIHAEPLSLPMYPHPYSLPQHFNGNPYHSNPLKALNDEFASLPVVQDNSEENGAQRRFSDPGIPNDSDSSKDSQDGRMIQVLIQQVKMLHESNRKLAKELAELRMEVNLIKQQQSLDSREYEPGMISDIIKEIRDAARVREDALLAKVKHMVEEKQFNLSQIQMTSMEPSRSHERLAKLEDQMKSLNLANGRSEELHSSSVHQHHAANNTEETFGSARQVCELEREVLQLRREVEDSRAKKRESDNKISQLEQRLTGYFLRKDSSDHDDGKASSSAADSASISTQSSLISLHQQASPGNHHLNHHHQIIRGGGAGGAISGRFAEV